MRKDACLIYVFISLKTGIILRSYSLGAKRIHLLVVCNADLKELMMAMTSKASDTGISLPYISDYCYGIPAAGQLRCL